MDGSGGEEVLGNGGLSNTSPRSSASTAHSPSHGGPSEVAHTPASHVPGCDLGDTGATGTSNEDGSGGGATLPGVGGCSSECAAESPCAAEGCASDGGTPTAGTADSGQAAAVARELTNGRAAAATVAPVGASRAVDVESAAQGDGSSAAGADTATLHPVTHTADADAKLDLPSGGVADTEHKHGDSLSERAGTVGAGSVAPNGDNSAEAVGGPSGDTLKRGTSAVGVSPGSSAGDQAGAGGGASAGGVGSDIAVGVHTAPERSARRSVAAPSNPAGSNAGAGVQGAAGTGDAGASAALAKAPSTTVRLVATAPAFTPGRGAGAMVRPSNPGTAGAAASHEEENPLHRSWCMHFGKPECVNSEWRANQSKLHTFATVEQFWRLFNAMREPAELQVNAQYLLFEAGVVPDWHAPQMAGGGRWCVEFNCVKGQVAKVAKPRGTHQSSSSEPPSEAPIAELWMDALLATIGESLEDVGTRLKGVVIERKKVKSRKAGVFKLWFWTTGARDRDPQRAIGERIRDALKLPAGCLAYFSFKDRKHKKALYRC